MERLIDQMCEGIAVLHRGVLFFRRGKEFASRGQLGVFPALLASPHWPASPERPRGFGISFPAIPGSIRRCKIGDPRLLLYPSQSICVTTGPFIWVIWRTPGVSGSREALKRDQSFD